MVVVPPEMVVGATLGLTVGEYIRTEEGQRAFIEAMRRADDMMRGAIVGAPAMPEDFETPDGGSAF